MKNRFFTVLIFLFTSTSLFAAEMPQEKILTVTPDLEVNNLAVFLDGNQFAGLAGESEHLVANGRMPPVMKVVADAIEQKSPLILQSMYMDILLERNWTGIFAAATRDEYVKRTRPAFKAILQSLKDDYWVTVNKKGDFLVALPRTYPFSAFETLGFDTTQLYEWNDNTQIAARASLNVANFKALFKRKSAVPVNIFAIGHGHVDPNLGGSIMMMGKQQYTEFLQALDAINTKYAYITSCQLGGMNAVKMHDHMTKFPLILGSSNDECPHHNDFCFGAFFKGLKEYQSQSYFTLLNSHHNDPVLKRTLLGLYGRYFDAHSIPLLRLPGHSLFRAVEMDPRIESITLEKLPEIEISDDKKERSYTDRPFVQNTDRLLYPAVIDVPLRNEGSMDFYSMIAGSALHILSKVKSPLWHDSNESHAAIWRTWGGFFVKDRKAFLQQFTDPSVFYKTFLIRLLQGHDPKTEEVKDIYEPVVVGIADKTKELVARVVLCHNKPELTNTWIHLQRDPNTINPISQTAALAKMKQMIKNAQPDPEALWHATDGRQNLQTIQEALPDELQAKNNDTCVVS